MSSRFVPLPGGEKVNSDIRINNYDRTRNNGFKLEIFRFRRETGKYWLLNRVVPEWNGLSYHAIVSDTMGCFKIVLDKFMVQLGSSPHTRIVTSRPEGLSQLS